MNATAEIPEAIGTDPPAWLSSLIRELKASAAIPADCRCLSREECASAIGVSIRSLDMLVSTGTGPPTITVAGRRLFPALALRKWIESQTRV